MRIESPKYTERFGCVRINDVQKVLELDSGRNRDGVPQLNIAAIETDEEAIRDVEERMAIVIPTKNEKLNLFEGVISGVPHDCQVIAVSNSQREPIDRFRMEKDTLSQFCHFSRRSALIIHQKDPHLARALTEAGYKDILGRDGLIADGKAEGMVAAMVLAKMAKKDYVGFIDADNYFPGSVWEYVKCYAAGFTMARSPYAMVRILWRYKPKISGRMYFKKYGRISEITNQCVNSLISLKTGFETEVVKTGNAGEHAMSMKLAEILPYASRFAVEPQELMSIFEQFGGVLPASDEEAAKHGVEVLQIGTRNPHLHEDRGEAHLHQMLLSGLGTIYHSPLCEKETKQLVIDELKQQGAIKRGQKPPKPRINTPLQDLNLDKFAAVMEERMDSYTALKEEEA